MLYRVIKTNMFVCFDLFHYARDIRHLVSEWYSRQSCSILVKKNVKSSLRNLMSSIPFLFGFHGHGFELATLLVTGTDCTGGCKSNYHTITTTTNPSFSGYFIIREHIIWHSIVRPISWQRTLISLCKLCTFFGIMSQSLPEIMFASSSHVW
jgi:hypothetical protein